MKKIGIITFHFVNNYGGALQTFALKKYIEDSFQVGEVEVIDYENWFIKFTDTVRLLPVTRNFRAFVSGMVTIGKRFRRKSAFESFKCQNFNLTRKYKTALLLKKRPPICDKYICGSDQIWNPIITGGVDGAYYLDFVDEKRNTCAYAPSFGTSAINPLFVKGMREKISSIGKISIREKKSIEPLEKWTGKTDIESLIDPTFLIKEEEWKRIAKGGKEIDTFLENTKQYILIYIMQADYSVYEYISQIKEKYQLPIVDISRYGYNPGFVDKVIIDGGPKEFLALFENASIVCTNSYHGLVFSLIFKKKLFLIPSKNFALRIINLLDLLKIDKTKMLDSSTITEIEYDSMLIDGIIEKEREKAYEYLYDFLQK